MPQNLDVRKSISVGILFAFLANTFGPMPVYAQDFRLPAPGVMVHLSPEFNPPILKGLKVHPDNPFRFDFILDTGDDVSLRGEQATKQSFIKEESTKLIKYFLASLTTPEKDLWVNLSPYEKDRIVPNSFGLTEMGRDLLAEDYMLKQITASLIYPEDEIGKKFWKRIYEEAAKKFGTTNIPVNTFNKVWIVPEKAVVYENAKAGTAYVVESKLKVMLESDYLAIEKNQTQNDVAKQIIKEIVIPELTKEVNEDKNFTQLRQVYNSLILATWYKKKIKDSILSQVYADRNKIAGVNIDDPQEKQKIYERYLQAFKKGAYNYIKEEKIPNSFDSNPGGQPMVRKYFSGGVVLGLTTVAAGAILEFQQTLPNSAMAGIDHAMIIEAGINEAQSSDAAMNSRNDVLSEEQYVALLRSVIQRWDATQLPVENALEIVWSRLKERKRPKNLPKDFYEKVVDPWHKLDIHTHLTTLPLKRLEDYKPMDFLAYFYTAKIGVIQIRKDLLSLLKTYSIRKDEDSVKALINDLNNLRKFMIDPVAMGGKGILKAKVSLNLLLGDYTLRPYLLAEQKVRALAHEWNNAVSVVQSMSEILPRRAATSGEAGFDAFNKAMQKRFGEFLGLYETFKSASPPKDFSNYFEQAQAIVLGMKDQVRIFKQEHPISSDIVLVQKMEDKFNDILSFISRRNDTIKLQLENLNPIVEKSVLFQSDREITGVTEIKVISDYSDYVINAYVDPVKLSQVILNIVKNATEAIRDTKKSGTIKITTRIEGDKIIIAISDDGPGIPLEIQDQIFKDEHKSTKSYGKGIGMGVVKKIIEAHGGTITFETKLDDGSTPDHGTTFFIKLPVNGVTANPSKPVDAAQTADKAKYGGIDLNTYKALSIRNDGESIKFHLDPAMLQQMQNAPGFTPVIINIQLLPAGQAGMADIRAFLGEPYSPALKGGA